MHHDDLIRGVTAARDALDRQTVSAAFLSSLGSRHLPWRSALGSYAVCLHLTEHPFVESTIYSGHVCHVCGLRETEERQRSRAGWEELRSSWPGRIRHTDILYAQFDLETFPDLSSPAPTADDLACFENILAAIEALPERAQLTELNRALVGKLKSNKIERQHLLEILGFCGILCPADQESYHDRFLGYEEREQRQPKEFFKRDWAYPVQHWRGSTGVNRSLVAWWFGPHLAG